MECSVCKVRSSEGYCVECQSLLCNECALTCETCSKMVCPDHVHITRSGRRLCNACHEERRARREKRKHGGAAAAAGATGLAALQDEDNGELEDEDLILAASAQRGPEPWQWSLYVAIAGLVVVALMLIFPTLRRIPLGGTAYFPTPVVILILPVFSALWAFVGLTREEYFEDRPKCFMGIIGSVLVVLLSIVAVFTDPARTADLEAQALQEQRDNMTPEELAEYRESLKDRYDR
ncbi:MAG: hypothetical protein GY851_02900 [bacterium]|nr:hypothetical protein [bacterium]